MEVEAGERENEGAGEERTMTGKVYEFGRSGAYA